MCQKEKEDKEDKERKILINNPVLAKLAKK